ncbi:MAG: hypothetical protein ACI9DJ_000819 [Algoriphagus sp.]|jgi:hypothetical protein
MDKIREAGALIDNAVTLANTNQLNAFSYQPFRAEIRQVKLLS